ncbi:Nucleosome assembly protein 1 [Zea mays]|uniref:Nucleosome assembly protein 1 n=1 Tax=Zea mays TaxID=4577 RepID=A0A1D6FWR6_MAIZE|nr:Nucleosome assembly protein 1 [Zea mays]
MSDGKDSLDLSALGAAIPNSAELSAEDKANLVASIKNTLEGLASRHTDVLESLEPKVRKRVEKLREIQGEHDELEAKFFEERAALEAKYQKLYEPLYSKRYEIVNGVVEVEGITVESAAETPAEQKTGDETSADQKEEKGVPAFWLNAMKNHEILAEEIQERDEEALKYLKNITWYRISEPKGFKLEFQFGTNPFFKNSVLTKTYHMIDEDEPILEKAIGTEIEWYPGKCLTQKVLKKKPRKGSKNTKPITKTEDCESFFNFFSPPQVPDDDEEIDEDIAEQLQNEMEQDYDIGRPRELPEGKGSRANDLQSASSSEVLHNECWQALFVEQLVWFCLMLKVIELVCGTFEGALVGFMELVGEFFWDMALYHYMWVVSSLSVLGFRYYMCSYAWSEDGCHSGMSYCAYHWHSVLSVLSSSVPCR